MKSVILFEKRVLKGLVKICRIESIIIGRSELQRNYEKLVRRQSSLSFKFI